MEEMMLDKWQKDVLTHEGNLLLCTGRQVGKTTILARKAAERMIKVPKSRIIIVSLTEDQAKLIIIMILDYLQKNYKKMIAKGKNKPTQNKVVLTNGSSSLARPVGITGDAVRGFTGDVLIIDEAAKMPELVWTSAKPTLASTGGEIWMCSTPYGKRGYFYECYLNKHGRYKVIETNTLKVYKEREISETWTEKRREYALRYLEEERKDMSELKFGQEYLGLFLEDLRQYFSDELIEKVCVLKRPETKKTGARYYLGADLARMGGDEITYEIIRKASAESLIHEQNIVKKFQLTTKTEQDILDLDKEYNFEKIYLDAGAGTLGVSIFDHLLAEEQTRRKVVAINNRAIPLDREGKSRQRLLKEDLYDNLRSLMEKGWMKLLDDDDVRMSLKSVQYEFVKSGDGNELTKIRIHGTYTHIAEGLIRAAWCSKEKDLNLWIASIKI